MELLLFSLCWNCQESADLPAGPFSDAFERPFSAFVTQMAALILQQGIVAVEYRGYP